MIAAEFLYDYIMKSDLYACRNGSLAAMNRLIGLFNG